MACVRILVDGVVTRLSIVPRVRCERWWRGPGDRAQTGQWRDWRRTHRDEPQQKPGRQQTAKFARAAQFIHG
jgi:predicted alpha/beta hydrolase